MTLDEWFGYPSVVYAVPDEMRKEIMFYREGSDDDLEVTLLSDEGDGLESDVWHFADTPALKQFFKRYKVELPLTLGNMFQQAGGTLIVDDRLHEDVVEAITMFQYWGATDAVVSVILCGLYDTASGEDQQAIIWRYLRDE